MSQAKPTTADYARQVNRRLSSACFLLHTLEQSDAVKTFIQQQTLVESALLQVYFAICHYLNELLGFYQQPALKPNQQNLHQLLTRPPSALAAIGEYRELKAMLTDAGFSESAGASWQSFSNLLTVLIQQDINGVADSRVTGSAPQPEAAVAAGNIIAAARESSEIPAAKSVLSLAAARLILKEFQDLVERQRQGQLEF